MRRIDNATSVASPPAVPGAGLEGYFTNGSPGGGVPATIVEDWWLNMMQGEVHSVVVAAGLTPSKTDWTQLLQAIRALTTGRLLNVQTFTASGTYTPTPGTRLVLVRAVGGGGAGGGTPSAASAAGAAAGGGAGAYGESLYTSGFAGVAVTIGAGGTGAAGAAGGNGGTTSFGALLSCPGGLGATLVNALPGYTMAGPSAQSGSPSGANLIGAPGEAGGHGTSNGTGSAFNISGRGGGTRFGPGGAIVGASANGNAPAAGSYGAGGSGASVNASASTFAGGAGAPGVVVVEEYA